MVIGKPLYNKRAETGKLLLGWGPKPAQSFKQRIRKEKLSEDRGPHFAALPSVGGQANGQAGASELRASERIDLEPSGTHSVNVLLPETLRRKLASLQ